MKTFYYKLLLLFVVTTVSLSCEDYLDVSPEDGISTEEVFSDYFSTRGVMDRATRLIQNYVFNDTDWSSEIGVMADENQITKTNFPPHTILNSGNWMDQSFRELGGMSKFISIDDEFNVNDIPSEAVGKAFVAIRAVNQVL